MDTRRYLRARWHDGCITITDSKTGESVFVREPLEFAVACLYLLTEHELQEVLAERGRVLSAVGQRADDSDRWVADLKRLLRIQAETATGEIANLRRQLAEVQAQNERLAADLRWHEIWIAEHQERIERLTAERDDLRQQLEEARS